ncbi:MAG: menaquinone biosynthesis protein [Chthoniobacter sp.]|uniref:menaquinone biosynthetic enzyme MqnA/MqnD family protein n=1 Tax=Chthoniobacter sp. TaxID=2510640 RepID=UPI0032A165AD
MRSYPALAGLRIGCVKYLNSKPLIQGYDGPVVFDHPSGLARDLAAGRLDVALVPTFEALRSPHYTLAEGVGIACDGPVYSVFLAHRGPLAQLRSVALDPASLTSVHLLQVLLREYHGVRPELLDLAAFPAETDAALIIGNQAIDFRQHDRDGYQILDLGEEWKRCTGLPFVFAPWLLRPDLLHAADVAADLRALKTYGLAHLDEIISGEARDPDFTRRYLMHHIRFELGEGEKAGIEKFRELLAKHGFIAEAKTPLRYA